MAAGVEQHFSPSEVADLLDAFEGALAAGNTSSAIGLVDRALSDGLPPMSVLCDVITPAQHWVGRKWQEGEWPVAREHIATGISLAATEAVARRVRSLPVTRGSVIVGCAEREWHGLAAKVVSTSLQAHGWHVTHLGEATPAERLFSYLHQVEPDAVAISCSIAGGLPSARRGIESATAAGIPVLVGGAAFGGDELRARAIGATAWAPTLQAGLELLEQLPNTVEPVEPLPREIVAEQRTLELEHHRLSRAVRERWAATHFAGEAGQDDLLADSDLSLTAQDCVDRPLWNLQAALVTGDGRLLREMADWVRSVLRARSVPERTVAALREEVLAVIEPFPRGKALVEQYWPIEVTG